MGACWEFDCQLEKRGEKYNTIIGMPQDPKGCYKKERDMLAFEVFHIRVKKPYHFMCAIAIAT